MHEPLSAAAEASSSAAFGLASSGNYEVSNGHASGSRGEFCERLEGWIDEAVRAVRRHWRRPATAGLILGTGMGVMAEHLDIEAAIPYSEIPHFPCSTALSHRGRLVCGWLDGVAVVTMDGRCHCYEGYSIEEITLPIHVMRRLGAKALVASNACGGLNPQFNTGDVMVVADHINFLWKPPVSGWMDGAFGRLSAAPYCPILIDRALAVARHENFQAHAGTYIAVTGPNYETRAEYRAFRRIGGDAVGMSTVPEAMLATRLQMRVFAVSTVTNVARPEAPETVDAQEVVAAAERAEPRVRKIVTEIVRAV